MRGLGISEGLGARVQVFFVNSFFRLPENIQKAFRVQDLAFRVQGLGWTLNLLQCVSVSLRVSACLS